ncbi:chemotaxis protein CheW [Geobacter sulfurreducens]|uniref:chemotaxis protein CheW n=1 Tax=Geobacter sulfurreducens TaxID=35554 RepID=UPI002B8A17BA|nr:chemotaxis protein CheW [Geobacter sulfurreducens]HML78919.1 chemotaxis protein CheW [Geobacter sulfurreducens]
MMDIAEIRRKAQRDRQQGGAAPTGDMRREPRPEPSRPAADAPPAPVVPEFQELSDDVFAPDDAALPVPASVPAAAPPVLDPLALILQGRRAALVEDLDSDTEAEPARETENYLEVLCFRVADETYGIDIMELKEIIKPRETTDVPHSPPFVAGVLSLRGIIIPVFILRERLGLADAVARGKERIVVVKHGEGLCGLLVDEVTQVVKIPVATIEHPPAVLDGMDREFVNGIGRHDGGIIILLQLEKVLDSALM